ncbi:MAG: hypothetical protein ACKVTZ_12610 [Bacteroidia bacterium]
MQSFSAITFIVRFSTGILLRMWLLWILFVLITQDAWVGALIALFPIYLAMSLVPFVLLYLGLQTVLIKIKRLVSQKILLHGITLLNTLVVFLYFGFLNNFLDLRDLTIVGETLLFSAITSQIAIFLTYQMTWAKNRMAELHEQAHRSIFGIKEMEQKIEEIGQ